MSRRRLGGESYALIFAALVIVAGGAILAGREDGSNAGTAIVPAAEGTASSTSTATMIGPTPTELAWLSSTPQPTATPQRTATTDILAGARIRTAEDAIAIGLDVARGLGAEHPRLVSVDLYEIDAAIGISSDPGDDPGPPWAADGAAGLAWLVQFDNDEFFIDSCEPPYDPTPWPADGAGHSCPTEQTAIFVIRASDGSVVAMALGFPVPR
jgi:hypothetical protein